MLNDIYLRFLRFFFRNEVRSNDKLMFFIMLILKLITQKNYDEYFSPRCGSKDFPFRNWYIKH